MTTTSINKADADALMSISSAYGARDGAIPEIPQPEKAQAQALGGLASSPLGEPVIDLAEGSYDFEDTEDADAVVDGNDLLMVRHQGKVAVVHDFAVSDTGKMYMLAMIGPAQVCTGIFAALVDQGARNEERVMMEMPSEHEGGSIVAKTQIRISVPPEAIGSMRHNKTAINDGRQNMQYSVIYTDMVGYDYDYRHVERPNTETLGNMSDGAKKVLDRNLSRFALIEHVESGESEEDLALRWYGFLTRRVQDGLLQDWALPLWRHCKREEAGITPLARLRGGAWLCEPDRAEMREIVGMLGRDGKLPLPENMRGVDPAMHLDAIAGIRAARAAAAAAD